MALYQDPHIKDPRDRDTMTELYKRSAKKVPYMNKFVPNRVGPTGKPIKVENPTAWNIFLNPAIVTKYTPSPGTELVLDLYDRGLGDVKTQFPRVAPASITVRGEQLELSREEQNRLQQIMGEMTMPKLDKIAGLQQVWTKPPDLVAEQIDRKILSPVSKRAKAQLIKELGGTKAVSERIKQQEAQR